MGTNGTKEMLFRVPAVLAKNELKDCIGIGLHFVGIGRRPERKPDGEKKSIRIKFSPQALKLFTEVEEMKLFESRNELITTTMAWLDEQPDHVKKNKW